MNTTRANPVHTRTYLTAGIAALGAGALVLATVQPLPDQTAAQHRIVSDLGTAVLASSFDPITPWVDTITTSIANIGALIGFALDKPFPILQTVIANLGTYLGELTSGGAGLIPGQIFGNIEKLFTAPFNPGEVVDFPIGPTGSGNTIPIPSGTYVSQTIPQGDGNAPDILNDSFRGEIVAGAFTDACQDDGECGIWPTVASAVTFLNSYGSGVLLGLLGPALSPVAALINSVTAIVDFVSDGDFIGAINEIVNIPANLVNGFLNGALLDLTPLVGPIFGEDPPLDGIGFRLGGLISGPMPVNGSLADPEDPPTVFSGGTGFDSLYAVKVIGLGPVVFPGYPIGPIGSLIGMGQYLSNELLVTPPTETTVQSAAAEAPAPVAAPDAPAVDTSADATITEIADDGAAEAQEARADAETPSRAGGRTSRKAPAAADADTTKKSSPRAAAASRR